jgi:hypothetical protein
MAASRIRLPNRKTRISSSSGKSLVVPLAECELLLDWSALEGCLCGVLFELDAVEPKPAGLVAEVELDFKVVVAVAADGFAADAW